MKIKSVTFAPQSNNGTCLVLHTYLHFRYFYRNIITDIYDNLISGVISRNVWQ